MISLNEEYFQRFCYAGRYIPPVGVELTDMQKATFSAFNRLGCSIPATSEYLRVSKVKVRSHLVSIRDKGWAINIPPAE